MIEDIDVSGVGMHPFGRFPELGLKDLARVAIIRALTDAGIGPGAVGAVYASNSLGGALSGQHQVRGQTVLADVGIEDVPVVNVENACAGGSTAFAQAITAVRAGAADTVLAVGFEKMFMEDREPTLVALQSAADLDTMAGLGLQFTAIYAMRLRKRLDEGSLRMEDLVAASVKSHANGALNPYAQFRKPVTAEEVVNSAPISEPLTLLMCSAICDGAAAAVVTRNGSQGALDRPRVAVRASDLRMGTVTADVGAVSTAARCAHAAYEQSGVGPADIGVFEVHDAMAPGELSYYEQLGLCDYGEAGELLRRGVTALGGAHPVNPSGGLSSRGHPVGATGLAQVAELVWQLRGEAGERQVAAPHFALAQNSGGWLQGEPAACAVHVLERVS